MGTPMGKRAWERGRGFKKRNHILLSTEKKKTEKGGTKDIPAKGAGVVGELWKSLLFPNPEEIG